MRFQGRGFFTHEKRICDGWYDLRKLMRMVAEEMMKDKFKNKDDLEKIVNNLVSGKMIHCYPISASEAKSSGLNINTDFPDGVHEFMNLYRSANRSVEYLS
ncbi:MAG: Serine dehydrogenase proteinase [Candidatus Methanolliviera sp. GoM_oil]|nr:MAG: Serine dehydrogenase proteinase [Candidatus Methanolliviera sp. GoM_oil]